MENDPHGFQGIKWGTNLADSPDFVLIESDDSIQVYTPKKGPPRFGGVVVDLMKFFTIDGQLARVLIRYRGQKAHLSIMEYLVSQFGEVKSSRGAMVRGLNQQFNWRGQETEINVTYRGLGERGFLAMESRILAPGFLDLLPSHSF